MFRSLRIKRALMAVSLIGLATTSLSLDASARGFGGGGGVRGGGGGFHFGGGGFHGGTSFRGGGGGRGPNNPWPPVGRGPRPPGHPWPPIGRHPWPPGRHPWPVGWHHHPVIPVGGPIVVGGAVAGTAVATSTPTSTPVATATCTAPAGSFVSVVFLPTITVSDVNTFLKTYSVTVADGPSADGVYRLRLSDTPLPANRIAEVVASMRTQVAFVSSVDG